MITIKIGKDKVDCLHIGEEWIFAKVNQLTHEGVPPCVQINVKQDNIDLILCTQQCPKVPLSDRKPSFKEKEILELWTDCDLDVFDYAPKNLSRFLKKLQNII